jgi:hypothetical protein
MVRSRSVSVLVVAALAFASASVATGTGEGDGANSFSDELRQDLAAIAEIKGITFQEAARRHDLREQAAPVIAAVVADSSRFADVFQDDSDGTWKLRILFVGDEQESRAQLASALPAGLPVQWEKVQHSAEALGRVRSEVIQLWHEIGLDRISEVSVDAESNRVVVGLPARDPDLSKILEARYGDAVGTKLVPPDEPAACNAVNDLEGGSRYNCTPLRGGIRLEFPGGPCSTMMWGKNKTTPTTKYMITAGHCADLNNIDFFHNGALVGRSNRISWTLANPRSDSRRIPTAGNATQMNRVYETPNAKSYAITSVKGWGAQQLNDWVCKLGVGPAFFGRSCGQIINADTTIMMFDKVTPAKRADFNGANAGTGIDGGDSGGSVVYSGSIFGIVSTLGGKYSVGRDVEHDMNLWLCLNIDCSLP